MCTYTEPCKKVTHIPQFYLQTSKMFQIYFIQQENYI
jgi:hypothetical protein